MTVRKLPKLPIAAGCLLLVLVGCGGAPGSRPAALACGKGRSVRAVRRSSRQAVIAFVQYRGSAYAIFVMTASGGGAHPLSDRPTGGSSPLRRHFQDVPAWSPDGTRLAFVSDRGGSYGVYVMNADGSGTRRLTSSRAGDYAPSWSPDGTQIVFARGPLRGRLYVMDADGSKVHPLIRGGQAAEDSDPAWSPDGTRIAFVRREPQGGAAIELVRPDGTGLCRLTPFAASDYTPAWSPDGRRVAYATGDGRGFGIAVVNGDGTGRTRLTRAGLDFQPAWSPDGTKIAFSRSANIYMMNPDGSGLRRLTSNTIADSPAWRPAVRP